MKDCLVKNVLTFFRIQKSPPNFFEIHYKYHKLVLSLLEIVSSVETLCEQFSVGRKMPKASDTLMLSMITGTLSGKKWSVHSLFGHGPREQVALDEFF